ncbi:MAG: tetratricopeptide repeat protein, partial [Acidobacteria bacterium]|nr:tetratricopeptide repeat protein [Acidobacteriota bacterium]
MLLVALFLFVVLESPVPAQQAALPAAPDAKSALADGAEFLKARDNQRALGAFERAIALEPHNAEAHVQRCRALAGLRRHEEAIAACTQSLRLNPGAPEAHCQICGSPQPVKSWCTIQSASFNEPARKKIHV